MYANSYHEFGQYVPSAGHQAPLATPPQPMLGQVNVQNADEREIIELMTEKELVDPGLHRVHAVVEAEVNRLTGKDEPEYIELDVNKPVRVTKKVTIPVHKHPGFNFVGKLMGPGGGTLKKMQEKLNVKLSVMGRGSMRVASQEEECLATGDPKFAHLKERLHIRISANGPIHEAYKKIAEALEELKPYLTADDNDEIVQQQTNELGFNPQSRGGGGGGKHRRSGPSMRGGRGNYPSGAPPGGGYVGSMRGRGPMPGTPTMIANGRPFMDNMGISPSPGMRGPPPFGGPRNFSPMPRGGYSRGSPFDMRGRYQSR